MSPFYIVVLVLNPMFCMRYINLHWPRKWKAPALAKVKKLWERYKEARILTPTIVPFSYEKQNQRKKPEEPLDAYDRIKASLKIIARPISEDEYKDYNSQESYDPSS